jgi:membrane associated rhomboid family serine protease
MATSVEAVAVAVAAKSRAEYITSMIPIGDDNRERRGAAWMTWLLIAANVLVFVFVQGLGSNDEAMRAFALVPASILSGGAFLTLVTSMFLHGGFLHLAGNMLFLGVFGDNIECRIGRGRYLLLYLGSGVVGALAHVAASAAAGSGLYTPLVGASGAISGILGAYLVLFPGNRVTVLLFNFIPTALSAWMVIGFWFLMQLGGGLTGWSTSGVAYLVHIGGFAVGWLWSRRYRRREAERLTRERAERLAAGYAGGIRWWLAE